MAASATINNVKLTMVVIAILAASLAYMRGSEGAISCGSVVQSLSPCLDYLEGQAGAPSAGCCSGVQGLYSQTQSSRDDRVTTCGCLKSQATALGSSLNSGNAADLAGKCGVNLGYPINTNTDCSSIP